MTAAFDFLVQRVTLITLGVGDLAAAKAFYARIGWIEQGGQEGVAFYQMKGCVLALFGRDDLAADQGRPGAALGTGGLTLAQNFATEAAVDAAFAQAIAAGGTALKVPQKVFWGGYSGYWADPDGHVWEVAMNPFWPLAADGSLTLPTAVEEIAEHALTASDQRQIADLVVQSSAADAAGGRFCASAHHWRHVMRENGRIIGHLAVGLRAMRLGQARITGACLSAPAIDPSHLGKGQAQLMLQSAIARARASLADHLLLFSADRLYAKAGFRRVENPMIYVDMDGEKTSAIRRVQTQNLMVLSLRGQDWDDTAELDLLGSIF